MTVNASRRLAAGVLILSFATALFFGCGGGGGGGGGSEVTARVLGEVTAPSGGSSNNPPSRVLGAIITVEDFIPSPTSRARRTRTVDVGVTDENGNYDVQIQGEQGTIVAIITNGTVDGVPVRICGLVEIISGTQTKNLSATTDLACGAALELFEQGALEANPLNSTRANNLEIASDQFLEENVVNFFDLTSVDQAEEAILTATDDGGTTPRDIVVVDPDCSVPGTLGCPPITVTTTTSTTTTTILDICTETTCANGAPLCKEEECDGVLNCADGSDEDPVECGTCKQGTVLCDNGKVICKEFECNGVDNCGDGSDESVSRCPVPPPPCTSGERRCKSGELICGDLFCNGIADCVDGSDEDQDRVCCDNGASPDQCFDGAPICKERVCDGVIQCSDSSDEDSQRCCTKGTITCDDGAQVCGDTCDGVVECGDGSDEEPVRVCCPGGASPDICADGTPVCEIRFCNGTSECPDDSDETDSRCCQTGPSSSCGDGEFICSDQVCDGIVNCANGSDEGTRCF